MTQNEILRTGLCEVHTSYDAILCDVWGVLHNGLQKIDGADDSLAQFRRVTNKPVVLITNVPRPNAGVHEHLAELGVRPDAFDAIVTSGDVVRMDIQQLGIKKIYHIGPERNWELFEGTGCSLANESEAEVIVCTGLNSREEEVPEDYRDLFARLIAQGLKLICANPDIVSEHGDKLVYCAGALAKLYAEMGGETIITGKPCLPIYDACQSVLASILGAHIDRSKILAIGDGLPTDVKGANAAGIDVLFVSGGIHAEDFGAKGSPDPQLLNDYFAKQDDKIIGALPRLQW
ncbi:TIGR01459 family HAD-type hydrolase [Polycladidibacter hongkongensis]|uniref:TIGR01459 family HAD-type hydrolase n=1 Tax=Polycladidibacter hongkongensis TaxID=1647556 RepID=UPI00082D68C6|nr:TIGR01459 family HAD-type hydrolase [Pseudovibrio hongkongensis]